MIEIPSAAIKHAQLIVLGIWPVNLLTLWARGHQWSWQGTPEEIVGLWQWGAFVAFSLAVLTEMGVRMFFALAERRRRIEQARAEGKQEARRETRDMLMVLNAAIRTNPDSLPELLEKYQQEYLNGSANP